ncbi:hypothetical protein [Streptomyces sp. NPDC055036]
MPVGAAKAGVPTFTHVRALVETDPDTPVDGSEETVVAAAQTGAAMHHCHVNSTSGRHIDRVLDALDRSRRSGSQGDRRGISVRSRKYGDRGRLPRLRTVADEGCLPPSSVVMFGSGEREPVFAEGELRTDALSGRPLRGESR